MSTQMTTAERQKQAIAGVGTTLMSPKFRENLAQSMGVSPNDAVIDRFARVTMTAIQQNPDLLNKDRNSLYLSVTRCAQDGLIPDGKQAALVAFGNAVSYMPMIGGLRRIAAKYGVMIATAVVYENDEFDYTLGVEPTMTHKPPKLGVDRGQAIGAWAEAMDGNGVKYLEVMSKDDIEKVRSVSRAKSNGPWVAQWGEMARKTVARRLWKSLPLYDLDERDASVMAAADAEFDDAPPPPATDTQPSNPAPRPGRPSSLQAVVDSAPPNDDQQDDSNVIDGEASEVKADEAPAPTDASSMF